jgi:hypothetical protein
MALKSNSAPIDLPNTPLGHLLVKRLTIGVYLEVKKRIALLVDADQFVTKFFSLVARNVDADAPPTDDSFRNGRAITEDNFVSLSTERKDMLADLYLANAELALPKNPGPNQRMDALSAHGSVALCQRITGDLLGLQKNLIESTETVSEASRGAIQKLQGELARIRPHLTILTDHLALLDNSVQRSVQDYIKFAPQHQSIFHSLEHSVSFPANSISRRLAENTEQFRKAIDSSISSLNLSTAIDQSGFRSLQDAISTRLSTSTMYLPKLSEVMKSIEREWGIVGDVALRQASVKAIFDETLSKTTGLAGAFSAQQATFATSDTFSRLNTALLTANRAFAFDGGLFAQSLAAVAASKFDLAVLPDFRRHSFLADALGTIEVWGQHDVQIEEGVATVAGAEAAAEELFATILELFLHYLSQAKTVFENQALMNCLALTLAAAALYVNIVGVQVARQASEDGTRDLASVKQVVQAQVRTTVEQTATQSTQNKRIITILEKIDEQLAAQGQASSNTRYVVKRAIPLKVHTNMTSDTVRMLAVNQVVELVARQSDWIQVRAYDYLSGEIQVGWVKKKYLKMIEKRD